MACSRCKLPYPDELITPMFVVVGKESGYLNVCGICALEVSNNLHGTNRKSFSGEQAEIKRQDALDWRRAHPNAVPIK
jgi:hypothetical protein